MDIMVVLTFALVVLAEIAIPLILGYCIIKKFNLGWSIFLYGALFFIVSQVIHVPLLILLEPPYSEWIRSVLPDPTMMLAALALFLGLCAGIVEEGIRYLVFSLFFPARRLLLSRECGLLFGVGWGGIESIIVALLVLQSMILYIVFVSGNSGFLSAMLTDPQQLAAVGTLSSLTPLDIIPGLFERIMTITLHIAFTLLVLYSVVRLEWRFLLAAIAWHCFVDFIAVYISRLHGIWPTEGILALNALLALLVMLWIWKMMGRDRIAEFREEVKYI
ncbi:MAG: hypothetical protein APR55_06035 [Methanolinea sp. SDB]|nr:MAG: hypothetical protein APR55_06035 [Methanolinea sp. SDB]